MKKENVIYIGGKRYVAEDKPEDVRQKPEPEEMKHLTPAPRKLSLWVPFRLLAGEGGIMVFGWIFATFVICIQAATYLRKPRLFWYNENSVNMKILSVLEINNHEDILYSSL